MFILFLITFIGLAGFGITLPLFPFYAERLDASPELITLTVSAYSLGQFVAAPLWGRLSDAIGRRPVLVLTMLGSALSYVMLGIANDLPLLLASRVFGGLMAGNIAAAFAYVSDVTDEKSRGGGMGMVSAGLGLGFMFGPAIGGALAGTDMETANFVLPAVVAAAVSVVAALATLFLLPESLPAEQRKPLFSAPVDSAGKPTGQPSLTADDVLLKLIIASFVFFVSMSILEAIYPLWIYALFTTGPDEIGYMFFYMGAITVVVQGYLVGRLAPVFGERKLVIFAAVVFMFSMVGFALASAEWHAWVALAMFALSSGFMNPSMSSLVSMRAKEGDRGVVLGWFQASGALGRVVGPAMAGPLYAQVSFAAPYWVGAAIMLPVLVLLFRVPAMISSARQSA